MENKSTSALLHGLKAPLSAAGSKPFHGGEAWHRKRVKGLDFAQLFSAVLWFSDGFLLLLLIYHTAKISGQFSCLNLCLLATAGCIVDRVWGGAGMAV